MDEYRAVMDDKGLAQAYRDLATIRLTALEFDQMKPADVIARQAARRGRPSLVRQRRRDDRHGHAQNGPQGRAGRLFAAMATDDKVPGPSSRAVQIAGSLGIDATASLPATARQD